MVFTKVGRRGQITLPKEVRHRIQVDEGDRIAFIIEGEQVILKPVTKSLLELRGSIPVDGEQDFNDIRQKVFRARAAREHQDE